MQISNHRRACTQALLLYLWSFCRKRAKFKNIFIAEKGLCFDHFGACPKDRSSFSWANKLQILLFGFFKALMAAAFLLFVDSKVLTLLLLSASYFFPALKHGSLSPFLLSSSHLFPATRASYSLLFALSFYVLFWSYPQNCWCWTPYIKKKSIRFY